MPVIVSSRTTGTVSIGSVLYTNREIPWDHCVDSTSERESRFVLLETCSLCAAAITAHVSDTHNYHALNMSNFSIKTFCQNREQIVLLSDTLKCVEKTNRPFCSFTGLSDRICSSSWAFIIFHSVVHVPSVLTFFVPYQVHRHHKHMRVVHAHKQTEMCQSRDIKLDYQEHVWN